MARAGDALSRKEEKPMSTQPWPINDKDLVHRLGEAIRKALTWEHLPNCRCNKNLRNECRDKILEEAFALYCKEHPEKFW